MRCIIRLLTEGITTIQRQSSVTHPMGSWAGITRFSEADKKWADYHKIPLYVHGPNGELRKYDPASGEDILIYSDLPISPKTPWLE